MSEYMIIIRKLLAICSLIIGGAAIGIPEPYSRFFIALATGLNAAALYLIKEELPNATGQNATHQTG